MKTIKSVVNAWYFPWVVIAIVLRLLLATFSLHPDIWGIALVPSFFAFHGIVNPYDFLANIGQSDIAYAQYLSQTMNAQEIFIYPPLAYFTLGALQFLLRPFYSAEFFPVIAANLDKTVGDVQLLWFLLLAKLPYLLFDFASLYLLCATFVAQKAKRLAFWLWLFNPVTMYGSYLIGNFDIIPVFFTIAAVYYLRKSQYALGFLLFGIAAAYKTYPILVALPLVFYFGERFKDKIAYLALLVLPYLLTSLPFITTPLYKGSVLLNPKNTKFLFMSLPVSGAEGIYIFVAGLVVICMAATFLKISKERFWVYPLAVLLLLLSVTHYHPQWFMWVVPFLVLAFVSCKWTRWPITLLFLLYVCVVFFFEPSLNIGIFSPIFGVHDLVGLTELLNGKFDVFQLKSLVRSTFAGIALFLVFTLLSDKKQLAELTDEK